MKRIILSAMVVTITAAMLVVSALAPTTQAYGQYYDAQYDPNAGLTSIICAPWSKSWDLSEGQWYFKWYRWCVDTSLYDPAYESSWYIEWGNEGWGEQANLCPESGRCTVGPGGSQMSISMP